MLAAVGRRKALIAAAAAAVVVLGAAGWAVFLRPSGSAAATVTYRATTVATGTLRQSVAASGTVDATDTEDLSFPAAGQVTAVWVTAGQKVAKGARLAAIDSASLAGAVAEAKATLATAQAKLAADSGASSAQRSADSAAITVAQGEVAAATTNLAGATMTAPFAGTVTSVGYVVGQQVGSSSAGAGSGAGTGAGSASGSGTGSGSGAGSGSASTSDTAASGAIHLVSTGSYEVQASVDATDVALIKAGNQVTITVGDSAQPVFGTVGSVGIVATTTSGVATFPVLVAVTGSPAGVYPGATASLQIVYKQLSDVLLVPTLAVSRAGGGATVLVQDGSRQVRTTITTGASSAGQTQVTGGLTAGQQVLVAVSTGTGGGTTGRTGRTGEFPGGGTFPGRTGGGFGTGGGTGTGGGAAPGGAAPGGAAPGGAAPGGSGP